MTQNEQAIANTLEIFRQSPGKLFKVDEIEKNGQLRPFARLQ